MIDPAGTVVLKEELVEALSEEKREATAGLGASVLQRAMTW